MKINYRRQHNNKRNFSRILFIILLFITIIAILHGVGALTKITQLIYINASAVSTSVESTTTRVFNIFIPKSTILQENQRLRTELQKLKITTLYNKALSLENSDIRELLNMSPLLQDNKNSVRARIISYRDIPYGTLLAKTESVEMANVGDFVTFGTWAIGRVSNVNGSIVLINLFTSSGSAYDVIIGDSVGTMIGMSNGTGKIILPRNNNIEIGTPVSLPLSSGLIIGFVKEIIRDKEDSMQTILIRTPFNLTELRFVTLNND